MKRNCLLIAMATFLVAATVCLNVYADKDGKIQLPDAVKAAIDSIFPNASIEEVKMDEEGIDCYEVEIELGDVESELTITPEGTVIEEETEINTEDLPEAIKAQLAGAKIEEATQEVEYYVVTLTQLDQPQISYTN